MNRNVKHFDVRSAVYSATGSGVGVGMRIDLFALAEKPTGS